AKGGGVRDRYLERRHRADDQEGQPVESNRHRRSQGRGRRRHSNPRPQYLRPTHQPRGRVPLSTRYPGVPSGEPDQEHERPAGQAAPAEPGKRQVGRVVPDRNVLNRLRKCSLTPSTWTYTLRDTPHVDVRHSKPINFFKAGSSGISRSSAKLLAYRRKKSAPEIPWSQITDTRDRGYKCGPEFPILY